MHNKTFIADGAFAIVGGRNIGDSYFLRDAETNFLDLLVTGTALAQLAAFFDVYWNSALAYLVASVVDTDLSPTQLQTGFYRHVREAAPISELAEARDALGHRPLDTDLAAGRLDLT